MAYVPYDESIYRTGHRMFGLTDPFAASHGLSGINHSFNAFGPWMLHGNQPFTERGGYHLSGLGAAGVPDGSIVVYQGKWAPTGMMGAQDVVSAVAAALSQDGSLTVRNVSSDASWTQNTPPFPISVAPFNVTLQLQVTNGMGFGSVNDIISIVRHYVYQVTGAFPTADSIPSLQPPASAGGGAPIATGQPQIPGAPNPSGTTDFGTWLENNALLIGLGIGALVILPKIL